METIDFFQQLRKQAYINQQERGITAQKNVTLTTEGLELYLLDNLKEFCKQQLEKATQKNN